MVMKGIPGTPVTKVKKDDTVETTPVVEVKKNTAQVATEVAILPVTAEDLQNLENDLNETLFPTEGLNAELELNCTDGGDEIVVKIVHSTGLILCDGVFTVEKDDDIGDMYDLCEKTVFQELKDARESFRPSVLRRFVALYDLDTLLEALAIIRPADLPWGWDKEEASAS